MGLLTSFLKLFKFTDDGVFDITKIDNNMDLIDAGVETNKNAILNNTEQIENLIHCYNASGTSEDFEELILIEYPEGFTESNCHAFFTDRGSVPSSTVGYKYNNGNYMPYVVIGNPNTYGVNILLVKI